MPKTSPTTKPGTRKLSDVAKHLVVPTGIESTSWPAVRKTCTQKLGITFDDWQESAGRVILARRADGNLAAMIDGVGLSLPRQVGKTYLIGATVFALCVNMPGLLVIWSAHHARTHGETFLAMQGFADRSKVKAHVRQVFTGSGDEEIRFHNGSRILFGARERGFGRGIPGVDVLIFDEAQILSDRALANMLATMNTSRFGLQLYIGTPPKPDDNAESFKRMRADALAGHLTDGAWIEFGADVEAKAEDRDQWRKANPSYPTRTPAQSMLRLKRKLTAQDWRREGLGIWDDFDAARVDIFGPGKWSAAASDLPLPDRPAAIGVAVSVDRLHASIAAAAVVEVEDPQDPEGEPIERVFVAPVMRADGVAWTVAEAKRIQDAHDCMVVIDEKGPTKDSIKDLEDADVALDLYTLDQYAEACSRFFDKVQAGEVLHPDSAELNAAVAGAVWRTVGDRQVWGRRKSKTENDTDVSMLEAATLAAHAAESVGAFNIY